MPRDLLFEIGVEEIPSAPLYAAATQLQADAEKAFADARLIHDEIVIYAAPRRLALLVRGMSERQDDVTLRYKGPAAAAAYDAEGNPTKAAEGFARGKGVTVDDLVRETAEGGEYMWAIVESSGKPAVEVLPAILAGLAAGLQWPKAQRWGSGDTRFIRPVRWLVSLFGDEVLPVRFAGLEAGRTTIGHRFLGGPADIATAGEYAETLRGVKVIADANERAALLRREIAAAADSRNGSAVVPEKTFAEVVNLVEWPTVATGHFDEDFLSVPREVLEEAMESHQRYFPIEAVDGTLSPFFVVAHNGDPARTDAIVAGHERVIRARLADAAFFYKEDRKHALEEYVPRLEDIVFQKSLGTLAAKVERIERLVRVLGEQAGANPAELAHALRAAHLCKADLVTHAVVEFTSLQGVMGSYYALASGEAPAVAEAIVEHYKPRFAGDSLPSSTAAMLVSAADKLDTICGIHAINQAPTGSSDPYMLRRFAIGVIAMVIDGGLGIDLELAIRAALDGYGDTLHDEDRNDTVGTIKDFVLTRLDGVLRERGYAYDTIDAVLDRQSDDLADAHARCAALQAARDSEPDTFNDLAIAYTRAANLGKMDLGAAVDESIMGAEEIALSRALDVAEQQVDAAMNAGRYDVVVGELAALRKPIDAFFENVLVMDADERLRENRLRLLNRFVLLFGRFADIGLIAS